MNALASEIRFLDICLAKGDIDVDLAGGEDPLATVHIFDEDSIHAVNAALASGRPLLVRGEPGVGKSQLARAAAEKLERVFLHCPVDIQTEAKDLLWRFDAIERLAKAQVTGALKLVSEGTSDVLEQLAVSNFMHPGPLWWAFDWKNAANQADIAKCAKPHHTPGNEKNGCVILIDEIDKAETDVPNGLLEALGARRFKPAASHTFVNAKPPYPLIVITTNEERALPDAFLRRCMVLNMELPREQEALRKLLVKRGGKHFPAIVPEILQDAATMLIKDRKEAKREARRPVPGQAEYLDLLRALDKLRPGNPAEQRNMLNEIGKFALRKHGPDLRHDNE